MVVDSANGASNEVSAAIISPLDARISDTEKELDELLLNYTENHPDVINKRLILQQLVQRKEESKVAKPDENKAIDNDVLNLPMYQELNVILSSAEAEAVALRTRVKRFEEQKSEKLALIRTISEVEAEFANLNRDYALNKRMYNDLLSRRESSNLSAKAEQTGDKLQFKIIEPPRTPRLPYSPDRLLLSFMVILVGLGGGIGAALLYEQLKPTFYTRSQLIDHIELPVLGAISMYWTIEEKKQRRFGYIVYGILILTFGAVCLGALMYNGLSTGISKFI